ANSSFQNAPPCDRCGRSGERRRLHRAARPPTAPAEPRSVEGEGGRALARRVLVETLRPPSDANVSVTSRPAMGDISGITPGVSPSSPHRAGGADRLALFAHVGHAESSR